MGKKIAVVCNYVLNLNRIGGMDRFYVRYDLAAKQLGYEISWYFLNYEPFDFYSTLSIFSANNQNKEAFFLHKGRHENRKYDILVTHFLSICTPFFKKVKTSGIQKIIVVDHNPRPLDGFPLSKILENKINGLLYSKYIEQFVGVFDYTGKHILRDYDFFLAKKITIIYNGIDTSVFVKRKNKNTNKFVVSSHLRHSKGIQDLILAVASLAAEIKTRFKLIYAGRSF